MKCIPVYTTVQTRVNPTPNPKLNNYNMLQHVTQGFVSKRESKFSQSSAEIPVVSPTSPKGADVNNVIIDTLVEEHSTDKLHRTVQVRRFTMLSQLGASFTLNTNISPVSVNPTESTVEVAKQPPRSRSRSCRWLHMTRNPSTPSSRLRRTTWSATAQRCARVSPATRRLLGQARM